jgi:hypothetical protein
MPACHSAWPPRTLNAMPDRELGRKLAAGPLDLFTAAGGPTDRSPLARDTSAQLERARTPIRGVLASDIDLTWRS